MPVGSGTRLARRRSAGSSKNLSSLLHHPAHVARKESCEKGSLFGLLLLLLLLLLHLGGSETVTAAPTKWSSRPVFGSDM